MAIGQGLLEAGTVFAETLLKTGLPIPAARHAPEIIRRAAEEKDREQYVIPKPHPASECKQKVRLYQRVERLPEVSIAERRNGISNDALKRQS